jgi:hypothetical protein
MPAKQAFSYVGLPHKCNRTFVSISQEYQALVGRPLHRIALPGARPSIIHISPHRLYLFNYSFIMLAEIIAQELL